MLFAIEVRQLYTYGLFPQSFYYQVKTTLILMLGLINLLKLCCHQMEYIISNS